MEKCAFHSDNVAIESCEVCGRSLCALCLWYGADGLRLCETHAHEKQKGGEEVFSPATYADAIQNAQIARSEQQDHEDREPPYQANKQDVTGLVSAVLALTALFSCCGGVYCLPIIGLALGAVAYFNADKAVDPSRTRRLAGIGLGAGGLMVLVSAACMVLYVTLLVVAMVSNPSP